MGFTLQQLLIFQILGLSGYGAGALLMHFLPAVENSGVKVLCSILFGLLFALLFASPIFQRLHLRPLWLPVCPHCRQRPDSWVVEDGKWPLFVFSCPLCEELTEVWLIRRVTAENVVSEMPCLRLCWPEFWGRWQRIQ